MNEKWAQVRKLNQTIKIEKGEKLSVLTLCIHGDPETLNEIMDFVDKKVTSLDEKKDDIDYQY